MKWEKKKIHEFAEVVTGGTPSTKKPEYWDGGTIPWLPSGACQNCRISQTNTYITEKGLKESSAKMMPKQTVVIALTGATTGKVGILDIEACGNQSVTGILPNEKYVPEYLYYYLMSIRDDIIFDSYGGAQKHISQGYVKNIQVPLPPLPVQQKIADSLNKVTTLIKMRKEQIAVLDKLAKDTFIDMFGDPKGNPMGWDKKPLGETIKEICYGSSVKAFDVHDEDSIPILRIPNIVGGVINTTDMKYVNRSLVSKSLLLKKGDILFVRTNGNPDYIARCAVFKMDGDFVFASYLIRARVDINMVNPEYVVYALSIDSVRQEIRKECRTTAGNYNININGIKSLKLIFPPIHLQQQFTERIAVIERQKEHLKDSLVELEALQKIIMKKAFSGELFC